MSQRCTGFRIPIFTVIHAGETIPAVFQLEVAAEQTRLDAFDFGLLAAEHPKVADHHVAQHFREQVIEVGTRGDSVHKRFIALFGGLEIQAVIAGIVKMVAFNTPGFAVHLPPLIAR